MNQIGQGGMGVVYRAQDRLTNNFVALKKVTSPAEQSHFASSGATQDYRLALANEFRTLASLRHPNIISVLDYGFDEDQQPFFTMELLESHQDILQVTQHLSVTDRISLLMQATQALIYLHRRKVIHRDLKPENIVVLPDGHVKVLDFGLALAKEFILDTNYQAETMMVGTVAYMAPELLSLYTTATEQSDLYALGVIAYQVFARRHPFDLSILSTLIKDITSKPVDVDFLDVSVELQTIIKRLLEKKPEDRFESAVALYNALRDLKEVTEDDEPPAIRRSFLEAATFVGRKAEFKQLTTALGYVADGVGTLYLVSGESGVGKSRLLDELRIQALSQGVRVYRGQAIATDISGYEVWQNVLRRLAVQVSLTDFEASVLKPLVPDIHQLLERTITTAEEIDAESAQDRLFSIIESILQRVGTPLLIILEDLHWAQESLPLLQRIMQWINTYPLMIVVSFRHDEAPQIQQRLSLAKHIAISRLTLDEVATLSESILGTLDNAEDVVGFLQRETEGNVFFILEILRELAEESSRLSAITRLNLPTNYFSGGLRTVIERRLSKVPQAQRYLLHLSAMVGRALDITLLVQITTIDAVQKWLAIGETYQILEIQDNVWRFTHDKLREGAIRAIPANDRQQYHQIIADALVAIRESDVSYAAQIAYHYRHAEQPTKEVQYAVLAGKQAFAQAAYQEAKGFFERAILLADYGDLSNWELAEIEERLLDIALAVGRFDAIKIHGRRATAYLGTPVPETPMQQRLHLARMMLTQLRHAIIPPKVKYTTDSPQYKAGVILQDMAAVLHVALQETAEAVIMVFTSVNLLETVAPTPELVSDYASLSIGLQSGKLHRLSRYYLNRAQETLEQLDPKPNVAFANMHRSLGYAHLFRGNWEQAWHSNNISGNIFLSVGDTARAMSVFIHQSLVYSLTARWEEGRAMREQVLELSERALNRRGMTWGLAGLGQIALYAGDLDAADAAFTRRETITTEMENAHTFNPIHSYRAAYYWRRSEIEKASNALRHTTDEVANSAIVIDNTHDIYSLFNIGEVALGLLELNPENAEWREFSKRALSYLKTYSSRYAVGEPRFLTYKGLYEYLTGRQAKAKRTWLRARQHAKGMRMPYEEGLANAYSGKYEQKDAKLRYALLARARQLFEQIDAKWELNQLKNINV